MYLERPAVNLRDALRTIFVVIVHKKSVWFLFIMSIVVFKKVMYTICKDVSVYRAAGGYL